MVRDGAAGSVVGAGTDIVSPPIGRDSDEDEDDDEDEDEEDELLLCVSASLAFIPGLQGRGDSSPPKGKQKSATSLGATDAAAVM